MSASSRLLVRLLLLALLALPSVALAAVPQYITYSGRVLDEFGEAVEGEVVLTVGIFKEVTDATTEDGLGNASWTDDFTTIVINGYFSIVLGSQTVLAAADLTGDDVWVALSIDNGPWMVPASQLTSAPFALQAETADTATVAETANAVDGPVVAETVTVGGREVIDTAGNWTGAIETTSAAKVGSLWVDGVLIIDNNNWVGPAPDLPSGTAVNGSEILVGTGLEDQIDTQISAFVGTEQDTNPLNHERYQGRDELLMEIENVGAVTALPSYAEEYLYHAPVTANDVVSDLQSTFVDLAGDTMTGDLVVEGTVTSKGTNDETDATAVTPGTVAFSLAPDPNGSGTSIIDTWQIEATETSFVIKDFQGSATEYVVIEENAAGVGLITLQPEGNATMSVAASSVDIAPSGSSGSAVTSAANITQDTVSLVNTSVGPALEISEGQVSANLNSNTNVLNLTQTGVSIGASGVPTTVVGDLSVQGDVNLTSQQILGTLTVEADNSLDAEELSVSATGVSITGTLGVTDTATLAATNITGNASVTGDTSLTGGLVINNGSRDTVTINGSAADIVVPMTIDANADNFDELAISTNLVAVDGDLTANPGDSTVEFEVAEAGVTIRDNLTVASGGANITQGGLTVASGGVVIESGGIRVDDGNLTVGTNADSLNEVAITDTGMVISGDLNVTGTITGTVDGSVSTSAITATGGNLTVTGDLDNTAEVAITDSGTTFNDAVTVATGGLDVTTGGVHVAAGGLQVDDGNLVIAANTDNLTEVTITETAVTMAGDLNVTGTINGNISGSISTTSITATTGNLTVTEDQDGTTEFAVSDTGVVARDAFELATGDLTVTTGNIAVTAGGITAGSGTVTGGALVATGGNATVTANSDGTSELAVDDAGVTVRDALTVATGGISVTSGGVAAANGTLSGEALVATGGNLTVTTSTDSNSTLDLTDSSASINYATDIDGGLTINNTGLDVTAGGIDVTNGGVTVSNGTVEAKDSLSVTGGTLTVSSAATGGLDVNAVANFNPDNDSTEEFQVTSAGATVTGDLTLSGTSSDIFLGGNIYGSSSSAAPNFGAGIDVSSTADLNDTDIVGNLSVSRSSGTPGASGDSNDGTIVAHHYRRSGCPTNYTSVGTDSNGNFYNACISSSAQSADTWLEAYKSCLVDAANLCSQAEYLIADSLSAYSFLDGDSGLYYWTRSGNGNNNGDDAPEMGRFEPKNGDNNDDLDATDISAGGTHPYLCCMFP